MKLVWICVVAVVVVVGMAQLDDIVRGVSVKRGTPPEISIAMPDTVSEQDQKIVQGAFQLLSKTCPDVARYWDQMTDQKVEFLPADAAKNYGLAQSRGWGPTMIRFLATVKDDAELPRKWLTARRHTLAWDFGAGQGNMGFYMVKDQAAWFCGRDHGEIVVDIPK